jgi:hypothetical protein
VGAAVARKKRVFAAALLEQAGVCVGSELNGIAF